jgi:hypothetical protein
VLTVSVILYCVASLGAVAFAAKYGLGPVPADYHAEILGSDGGATESAKLVLTVVYRVMAGALLAFAVLALAVALGPLSSDALWAKLVLPAASLAVAGPSLTLPRRVERATGVRTPWRPILGLIAVLAAACLLSFF